MSAFGPLFDLHVKPSDTKHRQTGQPHHISLDSHSHNSPDMPSWKWRITPLIGLCCIVLVVLAGRLWQLQIIDGAANLRASKDNSLTLKTIPAPRGIIYDSQGAIIARNLPSFSLAVTAINLPKDSDDQARSIARVANLVGLDPAQVKQVVEQAQANPVVATVVKANLDREAEIALLAAKADTPGFSVEEDLLRSYPLGAPFSHVLGYTGSISPEELKNKANASYFAGETIGKAGLEQFYDSQLHGRIGQRLSQVNAQGALQNRQTEQQPVAGNNLVLSLDSQLQQEVYQVLQKAMQTYHTTGAVGIIQNPQNGQILSLVSLPSYDNNLFSGGISSTDYQQLSNDPLRPLFDRSIAGVYPPGSLVKPLIGGQAVASGLITRDSIINSPSFISVGSFRYADWTYWLGRSAPGPLNVIQAIAQSCDTFFYQLGGGFQTVKGLGVQAITQYYKQAGFGSLTGIDLPGEAKGTVPDPAWKAKQFPDDPGWYVGNTYQLAIGQSYLLTTPLQVNAMVSAIANGGNLLQPQLVQKITDPDGNLIQQSDKKVIRDKIISANGLKVAQEGMRQAITVGIVFPFRTNPWPVAAKTGTAEFGTQNALGQYQTHSWVAGYAPADNPQISFTVLLESGGSSTNAAQVANEIVKWYADRAAQTTQK